MLKFNKNRDMYKIFKNYIESEDYDDLKKEIIEDNSIKEEVFNNIKKRKMVRVDSKHPSIFRMDLNQCDIIDCFYLIIKKDDLTHDFLKTIVKLEIGGTSVDKQCSIYFLIMRCAINGYFIKYDGENILVPIYNFNNFKTKFKGHIFEGYPAITVMYHDLKIIFMHYDRDKFKKGLFSTFVLKRKYRKKLAENRIGDLIINIYP
jgi:hypothetical protein